MATQTYYVHVSRIMCETVEVEVEVPEGIDPDELVDLVMDATPHNGAGELCASCMGYGRSFDRDPGDGVEIDMVSRDRQGSDPIYEPGSQWRRT